MRARAGALVLSAVTLTAAVGCSGAPSGAPAGPSSEARTGGPAGPSSGSTVSTARAGEPTSAPSARRGGERPRTAPTSRSAASSPGTEHAPAHRQFLSTGLRRLLDRRAEAVVAGDRPAWLGTLAADAAPTLRSAQSQAFEQLEQLPVAGFRYTSAQRTGPGSPRGDVGRLRVRVRGRISFAGYWRSGRTFEQVLTVQRPSGPGRAWVVVGVADEPGQRQVWQLPGLQVERAAHVLVAGNVPTGELRAYLRMTEQAVSQVAALWGGDWRGRVVMVVPRTTADFRAMSELDGESTGPAAADIAAATVGPVSPGHTAAADEVVVNPDAYGELRRLGRRVVVRHEVAHVATRATTTGDVPLWLSEGFAEYVAWSGVHLAAAQVAPELLQRVRDGAGPTALPGQDRFASVAPTAARAYHEGWLYCRYLAERFGPEQLVAFYRAAGLGDGAPRARAADAAEQVFGTSQQRLVRDWLRWLDDLARRAA